MPPTLCPICRKPVADAPGNRTFPFCNERCKLIDLGRWLDGKYAVPVVSRAPATEDAGELLSEEDA